MRPSRADRGDLAFTIAVAVVALLPRLFVAIAWAREPVWDGHYYHFGATRIATGLGYSEDVMLAGQAVWKPWCHYPVGLSGFLGLVYKVFGSGIGVAPVVNAALGALLCGVVHRLARQLLSENRARVAAGIAALHPGLIAYSAVVMTEPLAALLLAVAALCAALWGPRWLGTIIAGVVLGLATLVRPSTLLAAPLLALMGPRPWWKAALRGAAATAISLLVVSPWTLRNCRVMDGCALVSTNGGWNLAIGAISDTGRFDTLRAKDGCPIVTGQVQQDRCWAKVGRARIAADPARWLGLIPKKLGHTFDHESFAIEYLREADPRAWPESRRVAGRGLLTFFHRLLLAVAALSVVAFVGTRSPDSRKQYAQWGLGLAVIALAAYGAADIRHPFFWLPTLLPLAALLPLPGRPEHGPVGRYLLSLLFATALTHAIFFGDDRYHLVVTPVLCILAAAALRSEGERAAAEAPGGR
jgi:4-amino-4-deoxy-L-arabinose transferase-like glycosyltransferase